MASQHFTSVKFQNFKAFKRYSVALKHFNVMVGPNNSGKSTIIGALRILSEGIRKASYRKPELLEVLGKTRFAYRIQLETLPLATENVFHDYDDSEPAIVTFRLSDGKECELTFPIVNDCLMTINNTTRPIRSPSDFKREIDVRLGFVPILGPVEHNEPLYEKEAARLALLSHRASRNFRNIWHHYPEEFDQFRSMIQGTWPGMDILKPEVDLSYKDPILRMFCPENRLLREIYWAGYGFQVWCQMLTFVAKSSDVSLFVIDEPDIYLHADLQRQLIGTLKGLNPDILIATHSTEMICEADSDELLVVNKKNQSAKRISDPSQLHIVFNVIGSNLNPTLTQLAKAKRGVFVEGKDFQLLSLFARKLKTDRVANRTDFAVVHSEGFNPQKVHDLKKGIELALGTSINIAVIFDRDYRSPQAVEEVLADLRRIACYARIHTCKEIENYLLEPAAICRAIESRIKDRAIRTGNSIPYSEETRELLCIIVEPLRNELLAQYVAKRAEFERAKKPHHNPATINAEVINDFEEEWRQFEGRMRLVPGKKVLSLLNQHLQSKYDISITPGQIVNSFKREEIPKDIVEIIHNLDSFGR